MAAPRCVAAAARALRHKGVLRERAGRAGIPQPRWRHATAASDVDAARSEFGGYCVIKPASMQASVGVEILGPDDDVAAAWARTTQADEPLLRTASAPTPDYLVESRLVGTEMSVEAVVHDGDVVFQNVTQKTVLASRHPVELGHVVPADVDEATWDELCRSTARLADAVGFRSGVLHAEWIVVDGVPHLVECAGRLPGDRIHHLIDRAYGVRLVEVFLQVLSGERPTLPASSSAAAIRFLNVAPGRVTAIGGIDEARGVTGVTDVSVGVEVGDAVRTVVSSWERAGHVIAVAPDPQTARDVADGAASLVSISTVAQ